MGGGSKGIRSVQFVRQIRDAGNGAYQSFVLGQEDSDSCIDLTDGQRDQHLEGLEGVGMFCC